MSEQLLVQFTLVGGTCFILGGLCAKAMVRVVNLLRWLREIVLGPSLVRPQLVTAKKKIDDFRRSYEAAAGTAGKERFIDLGPGAQREIEALREAMFAAPPRPTSHHIVKSN